MEYIDLSVGMRYMGNIEKLYCNVVESFLRTYEVYDKQELPLTVEVLHNIRGISMNLGAVKLYDMIGSTKGLEHRGELCYEVFHPTYQELKEYIYTHKK